MKTLPPIRLTYVAKGTFEQGRYIRFPQGVMPRMLFILYADGSAGQSLDGKLARFFPAGSVDADCFANFFRRIDAGEMVLESDFPKDKQTEQ